MLWQYKLFPNSEVCVCIPCKVHFEFNFFVPTCPYLTRFKQKDSYLSKIEVDEVLGFVCDVASKLTSNNSKPCWVVFFVKLFLDVGSDVLFNVVFLQRLCSTVLQHLAAFLITAFLSVILISFPSCSVGCYPFLLYI